MSLDEWRIKWGIRIDCMEDLREVLYEPCIVNAVVPAMGSEAAAQQLIRLDASRHGSRLWRNNNGAFKDDTDRLVRYGLGNDSARVSSRIKSSDLIGCTPHVVRAEDVGNTLGIFTSIEVKRPGWVYRGAEREKAQLAWNQLIISLGGRATFATSPLDLTKIYGAR